MKVRQLFPVAILALGINVHAEAADFSQYSTEELVQMRPSEMSEADRNAFREEIRSRSMNMSDEERATLRSQMNGQRGGGQRQGMGAGAGQQQGMGAGAGMGGRRGR